MKSHKKRSAPSGEPSARVLLNSHAEPNNSVACASSICGAIKQRISIPWLWHYHNLLGDPKPGGRCRSPFYEDRNPDFFISRDGSWFVDHGEPEHKGDVIRFEMLASLVPARQRLQHCNPATLLPYTLQFESVR